MFKRADRGTAEIQASFFQYPTAALSRPSPALVALSVVAAVALPAVAGAKPSKKKIRKAARLDKVGKSLYANKRFSEAVVAFEEAFDTDPKAKYLFNLAKAHDKNGNLPEAIDAYERYVDRAPNAQDAEDIQDAQDSQDAHASWASWEVSWAVSWADAQDTRDVQDTQGIQDAQDAHASWASWAVSWASSWAVSCVASSWAVSWADARDVQDV